MRFLSHFSYPLLALLIALWLGVWAFWSFSWLLFGVILAVAFIYRNTAKSVNLKDDTAIIAPIAGLVESISRVNHKDLGVCTQLIIKNALYNEGVIVACAKMRILRLKRRHGLFTNNKRLSLYAERALFLAKNGETKFGIRVLGGTFERQIKLNEVFGECEAGAELGFSLNSKIALFLPQNTRLLVNEGDFVKTCTLLGYFENSALNAKNSVFAKNPTSAKKSVNLITKNAKNSQNSVNLSENSTKNSRKSVNLNENSPKNKLQIQTKNSQKSKAKTQKKSQNSVNLSENSTKNSQKTTTISKTTKIASKTTASKTKNSQKPQNKGFK